MFRYLFDPLCVLSMAIYAIGRFYLRPHHIGGAFVHSYLNDLLCLPIFLPISLVLQRLLHVRKHDGIPRVWEVIQHWIVFSVVFEIVLPKYPTIFTTTADPWDSVSYLVGGAVAYFIWKCKPVRGIAKEMKLSAQFDDQRLTKNTLSSVRSP